MNDKINQLLWQMATLEAELRTAVQNQESRVFFQIRGKRVEFEKSARDAHRKLKTGVLSGHARYHRFLKYGEAEAHEARLEKFRVALGQVK